MAGAPEETGTQVLQSAQTRDFIEYGFEPEFIWAVMPVRVVCEPLSVDDLFQVLKTSEGSIIRQYEQSFGAYGIEAKFAEDGLAADSGIVRGTSRPARAG